MRIDPDLWSENVEDVYRYCRTLNKRPSCSVTKSKLNKLFREGGKIEMALTIYASVGILEEANVSLSKIQENCQKGAWYNIRDRLRDYIGQFCPKPRWEHVTPVSDCIGKCIEKSKKLNLDEFKEWFNFEVKTKWFICLVTAAEDKKLIIRNRNYNKPWQDYENSNIKIAGIVRDALI